MSRLAAPAHALLSAAISVTPPPPVPSSCAVDMVEITGEYCPALEQFCIRPVDPQHLEQDRCAAFAQNGRCQGTPVHKHFCIDRYEWPNQPGVKPAVDVDWLGARERCAGLGRRLCSDAEWTLACEGKEHVPYPYGFARNAEACNIDKPYLVPDDGKVADPRTRAAEFARLDQREPSGARPSCVSPYGVFDMTGNVDEWVVNEMGREDDRPFVSGLKGGYWGPVRDRCRPMTTDHNQSFRFYQIGFRCCADVGP